MTPEEMLTHIRTLIEDAGVVADKEYQEFKTSRSVEEMRKHLDNILLSGVRRQVLQEFLNDFE